MLFFKEKVGFRKEKENETDWMVDGWPRIVYSEESDYIYS